MTNDTSKTHIAWYMWGAYNIALLVLLWGALQNYVLLDRRLQAIEVMINNMPVHEQIDTTGVSDLQPSERAQDCANMPPDSNRNLGSDDDASPPGDHQPDASPPGDHQPDASPSGDHEPDATPPGDLHNGADPTSTGLVREVATKPTEHGQLESGSVSGAIDLAAQGGADGGDGNARQTTEDQVRRTLSLFSSTSVPRLSPYPHSHSRPLLPHSHPHPLPPHSLSSSSFTPSLPSSPFTPSLSLSHSPPSSRALSLGWVLLPRLPRTTSRFTRHCGPCCLRTSVT